MKIINFVICDDIRFEKDNKISLMGLYDDVISFNVDSSTKGKWPKPFSFAILLKIQIEEKDIEAGMESVGVTLEINGDNQKIAKIEVRPEHLKERKQIALMPKINNFPVNSEGNLTVKVSLFGKDEKEIDSLESPTTKIIESVIDNL